MALVKKLWRAWNEIGRDIADFQSRLLLTLFYFTVILPFGVLARFFDQSLDLHPKESRTSSWVRRETAPHDLQAARRHF